MTCVHVAGNFLVFRKVSTFPDFRLSPVGVIVLPRTFIEAMPNSHLRFVNVSTDLRKQSNIRLRVGSICSSVSNPHPILSTNWVHKLAVRQES